MCVLIGAKVYQLLVPGLSFFDAAGVAVVFLRQRNWRLRLAEESFARELVSRHISWYPLMTWDPAEFNRKLWLGG